MAPAGRLAAICVDEDIIPLFARIEPVIPAVDIIDPVTCILPEEINPFLAINSFAIFPLFHYPKVIKWGG